MEEDPRRRGLKVTCMLLPATTCTGSYLFLTQTAWPLKKQHLRGKTDFRDGVFSPPQSSEDKKLSSGCHLPSIIYCSTKEPFYFFWLSAKEPNEKLIHLAWHPAWPKEQKQKKNSFVTYGPTRIWTMPPFWVPSPALPCAIAQPGHRLKQAAPSRWAFPPYNPSVQPRTQCRLFCQPTLQFLSDVSQQTAE